MNSKQERLIFIDALRGIAALTVVFYHARGLMWVGMAESIKTFGISANPSVILGYLTFPLKYGYLGVQLFFVMSGFCIHRNHSKSLAADPDYSPDWKEYTARRLFRIYPTYIAALLITALIDLILLPCLEAWGYFETPIRGMGGDTSFKTFILNLLALQNICSPNFGSNGVFWTLALELHFYLTYPIIFFICKKFGSNKMLVFSLLSSGIYLVAEPFLENLVLFRLFGFMKYWFIWCLGAYIADLDYGRVKHFTVRNYQILIVAVVSPVIHHFNREIGDIFFSILFSLIIYKQLSEKISSTRWASIFAKLGIFSYSLYAIHLPVLLLMLAWMGGGQSSLIYTSVFATVVALGLGYLFFLMVEKWTLRPFWRH